MEKEHTSPSVAEQFNAIADLQPLVVYNTVPEDGEEQKAAYLRGEITQPHHEYRRMDEFDIDQRKADLTHLGMELMENPALNPKFAASYGEFVDTYQTQALLLENARTYRLADDPLEKQQAASEFMRLNIERYGEPEKETYHYLLGKKLAAIRSKNFTGRAKELADELFALIDLEEGEIAEGYKPSDETVAWMHEMVESLYGNMLEHVPEQKEFNSNEIRDIFEEIIHDEFGEAAEGWTVIIDAAKSINVKPTEKLVVIPPKITRSHELMRGLVTHELGVHMLRSITGSETDFGPLSTGLSDYDDSEEGLGKVMEQALKGKFAEVGVDYYVAASLAYFEGKSFDDIVNIQYRLALLGSLKEDGEVTDELIEKKRATAYNSTYRIMRGTDELPLFKDLSYYNGSIEMWKHLEHIRGDDTKFMFVLMGKGNPANIANERLMYETKSV